MQIQKIDDWPKDIPKYDTKKLFKNVDYKTGQRQGLFLARKIKRSWETNGYVDALVIGRKSKGKTAYALWVLYQVYGDWDTALSFLFMDPRQFLKVARWYIRHGIRIPAAAVDDAGMGLNRTRWWSPEIVAFAEFYNVARTVVGGMVFTAPSQKLPTGIFEDVEYRVQLSHVNRRKLTEMLDDTGSNFSGIWKARVQRAKDEGVDPSLWCKATLYTTFTLPDMRQHISNVIPIDYYPLHYPDPTYQKYEEIRLGMVEKMIDKALAAQEEPQKWVDRIYNAWHALNTKGMTDTEIAGILKISRPTLAEYVANYRASHPLENVRDQ